MSSRLFKLIVSAATAAACRESTEPRSVDCTLNTLPAVEVEIRDGRNGALLTAGARGAVHEGPYLDSLRPHFSVAPLGPTLMVTRAAASERAGTYTVEVEHPGYIRWSRSPVLVWRDECHVQTVKLTAWLQPAP
jgi:hypothetical protein